MEGMTYERNLTGSFMKADAPPESFDEKLLIRRKIPGLLPMEKCFIDGRGQYWYNITGKQSLETYCSVRMLDMKMIEKIIIGICSEIELLEKNLITADCLLLSPDLIFLGNMNQEFIFTAFPGDSEQMETLSDRFRELMEYLLEKIDHKDPDAVETVYGLYEKTLQEGYSILDIRSSIIRKNIGKTEADQFFAEGKDNKSWENKNNEEEEEKDLEMIQAAGGRYRKEREKLPESGSRYKKEREILPESGDYRQEEQSPSAERKAKQKKQSKVKKESWITRLLRKLRIRIHEEVYGDIYDEAVYGKKQEDDKSRNDKDAFYITPFDSAEEDEEDETPVQINATVCLNGYTSHPEGLLVYEGTDNFESIRIGKDQTMIGQGKETDVVLGRNTISHMHAKIVRKENEYYLEDLNSTNGTFVNGRPLAYKEAVQLKINDIVRFADLKYRFV